MDTTELDRQIAAQTITNFRDRFGVSHYRLAQYASLPLLLTPELVSFLRSRFLRGEVPWIAEADLLLSDLCRQVGYERFVMESAVKAQLLSSLEPEVKQEVALLLLHYTAYLVKEKRYLSATELETQQWSAMFYLDDRRETAVRQIVERFRELVEENSSGNERSLGAAMKQLAGLVNEFAPQLQDYPEVLDYARQVSDAKSPAEIPISIIEPTIQETPLEEPPLPELQEEPIIEEIYSGKSLYLIAIGGSGARVVESVVNLAAVGLMSDAAIKILFVDPDRSNGNYLRACKAIDLYNQCRKLVWKNGEPCQWMRTPIINLGISTLDVENQNLANFFDYNAMNDRDPVVADLFNVLYTKQEQHINLSEGFRGRVAIASAFMSQLNFKALRDSRYVGKYPDYLSPWAKMLEEIDNSIDNTNIKILLCGSVFGATGASGLSVIARLLDDCYKGNGSELRDNLNLGSVLILPYFDFKVSGAKVSEEEVHAFSPEFALNTTAAMQYYKSQMQDICNVFYCIGDHNRREVEFSIGGENQENKSHIVELYAALAIRDFIYAKKPEIDKKVVFAERRFSDRIEWADLPCEPSNLKYMPVDGHFDDLGGSVVRTALHAAVRFAFAWYNSIVPELEEYCLGNQGRGWERSANKWLGSFFNMNRRNTYLPIITNPLSETGEAVIITRWCEDFARWLIDIHGFEAEAINLFFIDHVTSPETIYFGSLLQNDHRPKVKQKADTIESIKLLLDPKNKDGINLELFDARGYVGLAKYLYVICGL
jgi:hypothetical protein